MNVNKISNAIPNRKIPKVTQNVIKISHSSQSDAFSSIQRSVIKQQPLFINREVSRLLKKLKIKL